MRAAGICLCTHKTQSQALTSWKCGSAAFVLGAPRPMYITDKLHPAPCTCQTSSKHVVGAHARYSSAAQDAQRQCLSDSAYNLCKQFTAPLKMKDVKDAASSDTRHCNCLSHLLVRTNPPDLPALPSPASFYAYSPPDLSTLPSPANDSMDPSTLWWCVHCAGGFWHSRPKPCAARRG